MFTPRFQPVFPVLRLTSQVCRSQFFAGRLVWRPGASEEATKQATSAGLADVFQPSGAHSEARCPPREHGKGPHRTGSISVEIWLGQNQSVVPCCTIPDEGSIAMKNMVLARIWSSKHICQFHRWQRGIVMYSTLYNINVYGCVCVYPDIRLESGSFSGRL
jgi:hypothetical protein